MAANDTEYEFKPVNAVRGMEARTVAKWESEGWELVNQTPGTIRTELTFRRPKPKWRRTHTLITLGGAAGLAIVAALIGAVVVGDNDDLPAVVQAPDTSATSAPLEPVPSSEAATPAVEGDPAAPAPSETESAAPATAADDPNVAALLTMDYCDPAIGTFAANYEGRPIAFDGLIADLARHGDSDTRYDILISAGDDIDSGAGPAFKYEDVNTTSDFGWTDPARQDTVGEGDRLRFTAEVVEYRSNQCLLYLDPIATEFR
ncbi:DUF4839 domain-containing protein [Desertihabitans aurantiacus]|uniref:DUF4839 domain-containing protein n=1 Tax=Desertihabitans aurantiacus TaxID=2282477 RepID=UPI001300B62D|nr:DUF4839 domain-containing protein [Desertihabitans aurantiacus]